MELPDIPAADIERFSMLQAGLDLLDQGLTVFDANLGLVAWNAPFLRLLEFPAEMAYVGAPFESFIRHNAEHGEYGPGDVDRQVSERVAIAARFAPHTTERVRPNGKVLLLRGEPLAHNGFVTLYTDITAQRHIEGLILQQNAQLEDRVRLRTIELERANADLSSANGENSRIAAALGRSEARLRLINDSMPFLIGYVDEDEKFQYANKGYSDWFDVSLDEVVDSRVRNIIGAEAYGQVQGYIQQALAGTQCTYEYHMERRGKTVFARSTLVPERAPDQRILGFFSFSQDITEQKTMQAALTQSQKMESLGQLTGGLAHDFNNLLTVIIGTLVILKEHPPEADQVNEFIEPALQSARRGAELIKRLLSFSRQQALEPVSVELVRLIGDMCTLVRRSLPGSITVTTSFSDATIICTVDPAQLDSALFNFVMNARDAMPDGGRLAISARRADLSLEAELFAVPPGPYALIEIVDSGCGMDMATLARAYEPFFTTKRFGMGSGLGLSMAYGLVKQSGGGIVLQSQPGQGTTVRLVLPLSRNEAALPSQAAPGLASPGRELVLLVEDEPNVRRVVRQQLTDLGYPVIEAENGMQALDMISRVPDIGIILCDVVMPGEVDGRQLSKQVMANYPLVRMLLMSGYNDGADAAHATDRPVLSKPFTPQELARALRSDDKGNA